MISGVREGSSARPYVFILIAGLFLLGSATAEESADCGCNSTCTDILYDSTSIAYENHTIYFRNNCSQSVWIAANMGPNGPPFVLNNVTQGRGCTGCSCSGPSQAGWKDNMTCCPSINCTHQSCPNSSCSNGVGLPNDGGFEVSPGLPVHYTVQADPLFGGNAALFPRYGCTLSPDGVYLDCDTGTCYVQGKPGTPPAGIVKCGGVPPNGPPDQSPQLPTTKMEIFFAPTNWSQTDSDFYDVSLADGYNIPVQIEPMPGTFWTGGTAHNWCIRAGGTVDLFEKIQQQEYQNLSTKMLVLRNNRPVAIWSSCSYESQVNKTGPGQPNATTVSGQGETIWNLSCCKGNCGTESTCPIGNLPADHQTSQFFGTFYEHTYTYQYGDDQANIPCKGEKATGQLTSYLITFCGGRVLATAHTHFVNVTAGIPALVSEPADGVNLTINSSANRMNQRVTFLTFDPSHPPQNFSRPIRSVGGYYEISSNIPDSSVILINLTARYQVTDSSINESTLRLFTYNGTWVPLTPGGTDPVNQTVWGHTNHFGVFTMSEYEPPAIGNLDYTIPDPAEPLIVKFTADVESKTPLVFSWDVNSDGIGDYPLAEPIHTYAQPGEYQVTLTVTDESGLSVQRLETIVVSEFAIPLSPGWNFISVPKRLDPTHASMVFAPVESTTRVILTYDPSSDLWDVMGPDTPVIAQQGFWLNSVNATLLPLMFDENPAQIPPVLHLYPGWNAIGLGDTEPLSASLALQAVGENWTVLIPFNAKEQRYETSFLRGASGTHGDEREMEPGLGYWLFMSGEDDLPATGA